jgi:hypothetical protein
MELRCPLSICVQEFEDEEGMKKHLKEEHPERGHTYVDDGAVGDDGDDGDGNNAERNNGEDAGSKDNDAGNERS